MTSSKTFAFIFARGGSKGLPRKNILPIGGVPMLVHGIHIAKELHDVAAVFVSTDCPQIADIATSSGAELIHRPAELASDLASEWQAWQHAVHSVMATHGSFDRFLSLPPTAPCRNVEDVRRCLDALVPDVDLVLTMTPSHRSPWFNMVVEDSNGCLELVHSGTSFLRRQDTPACYDLATVAYAATTWFVLNASSMWEGRLRGVQVPVERAIDIDTPLDYAIARFLKEDYPLLRGEDSYG
jgi:N-acylneuraminate cytidylyltransferase